MYYDAEGNLRLELPGWGSGSGKPGEDLPDSPEDLNIIYSSAFYNCSNLTKVNIPYTVHTIESYAFSGCTSLNNVVLPYNLVSIGDYGFSGCDGLTEITLPESLDSSAANEIR